MNHKVNSSPKPSLTMHILKKDPIHFNQLAMKANFLNEMKQTHMTFLIQKETLAENKN